MTYTQKMRRVVVPQADSRHHSAGGQRVHRDDEGHRARGFLGLRVAQMEIFRRAQLVGRADFRNLEALIIAALMYWGLTTVFQYFQVRLERRLSEGLCPGHRRRRVRSGRREPEGAGA